MDNKTFLKQLLNTLRDLQANSKTGINMNIALNYPIKRIEKRLNNDK